MQRHAQSLYLAIWSHSESTVCGCEQDLGGVLWSTEPGKSQKVVASEIISSPQVWFQIGGRGLFGDPWLDGEQVVLGSCPGDTETAAELWEDSAQTQRAYIQSQHSLLCQN